MKHLIKKTIINPDSNSQFITDILNKISIKQQSNYLKIWNKLNFYEITYLFDGLLINGFLIEPKKLKKSNPAIIYNRGGSKEYGKIDLQQLYFLLSRYADMEYVLIASQYRGNAGSQGHDECGGTDINDVLNLRGILSDMNYIDLNRISMVGHSRGGMMTYIALSRVDWIKSAIVLGGVSDLEQGYQDRPMVREFRSEMYDTNSKKENNARSAIFFASEINKNTPILILHGTEDKNVNPLEPLKLCQKLQQNGNQYELHMYNGLEHSVKNLDKINQIKNWLNKFG